MEGGKGLSRCPGEGGFTPPNPREMDDREAITRLPPIDAGNLRIFYKKQTDSGVSSGDY